MSNFTVSPVTLTDQEKMLNFGKTKLLYYPDRDPVDSRITLYCSYDIKGSTKEGEASPTKQTRMKFTIFSPVLIKIIKNRYSCLLKYMRENNISTDSNGFANMVVPFNSINAVLFSDFAQTKEGVTIEKKGQLEKQPDTHQLFVTVTVKKYELAELEDGKDVIEYISYGHQLTVNDPTVNKLLEMYGDAPTETSAKEVEHLNNSVDVMFD